MMEKYVHPKNIEQLFNNLLFDVQDKLTIQEIYNITRQYNNIMLQEKLQQQEQEKKKQKQEQQFLEQVRKEVKKTMTEIINKLNH